MTANISYKCATWLNSDASSPASLDPGDSGHGEALPAVLLHWPGRQHQNPSVLCGLGRQDPRQESTCGWVGVIGETYCQEFTKRTRHGHRSRDCINNKQKIIIYMQPLLKTTGRAETQASLNTTLDICVCVCGYGMRSGKLLLCGGHLHFVSTQNSIHNHW